MEIRQGGGREGRKITPTGKADAGIAEAVVFGTATAFLRRRRPHKKRGDEEYATQSVRSLSSLEGN